MCRKFAVMAVVALAVVSVPMLTAADTEQDIVNRYLKKAETKHVTKISWLSANFTFNRINRNNDYNRFAIYNSDYLNTSIPWLGDGKSFGIDLGIVFRKRLAWSVGGEYWLKMGINETGTFNYDPPDGSPTVVTDLFSEVRVYGVSTSIQYYVYNPPAAQELLTSPAVRIIGSVGYYQASWDIWNEYQNLNLATDTSTGGNATFKGSAPGFSFGVGIDYPLKVANLALGVDFSYMYLNFKNVAWYNAQNQEVIATYDDTPEGRVNLGLSGFRGKVEIKRFFKW